MCVGRRSTPPPWGQHKIRNPNFEIRNKSEARMEKRMTETDGFRFGHFYTRHSSLLGFRTSDLGFSADYPFFAFFGAGAAGEAAGVAAAPVDLALFFCVNCCSACFAASLRTSRMSPFGR